jgi:hypothetical protein
MNEIEPLAYGLKKAQSTQKIAQVMLIMKMKNLSY